MKNKIWMAILAFSILFLAACGDDTAVYVYGETGEITVVVVDNPPTDDEECHDTDHECHDTHHEAAVKKDDSNGQGLVEPAITMQSIQKSSIIEGNAGMEDVLVSAQIYNESAEMAKRVQIAAATVSDANGNYKLFLEPGTYSLVGYKDGYDTYYKDTKIVTAEGSTSKEDISIGAESSSGVLEEDVSISGADAQQCATFSIRQSATVEGKSEQIEVKSFNVANGGTFSTGLPVENYSTVISTYGKTTKENLLSIVADQTTAIATIAF